MMNGNILIEKIWYDTDFYEVQIIMNTEQIHCKIKTYIVDEEINALSQKMLDYVKNDIGFYWEIGEEDSDSCPKIIIESSAKDISGHIVLNASCQLQSIEENAKCNYNLSLIHISEPTRRTPISYAVFCLKKFFFNDTATTEIYT